jgi:hypothetical protein
LLKNRVNTKNNPMGGACGRRSSRFASETAAARRYINEIAACSRPRTGLKFPSEFLNQEEIFPFTLTPAWTGLGEKRVPESITC